jgi:hypothetical protein
MQYFFAKPHKFNHFIYNTAFFLMRFRFKTVFSLTHYGSWKMEKLIFLGKKKPNMQEGKMARLVINLR